MVRLSSDNLSLAEDIASWIVICCGSTLMILAGSLSFNSSQRPGSNRECHHNPIQTCKNGAGVCHMKVVSHKTASEGTSNVLHNTSVGKRTTAYVRKLQNISDSLLKAMGRDQQPVERR